MPTRALRTLEQLRETAVEEAKRELEVARAGLMHAEELSHAAATRIASIAHRLEHAREAGHRLSAPADYLWAERQQRALRAEEEKHRARQLRAQSLLVEARTNVARAERGLLEAELGRRAASRVVQQRETLSAQKAELRVEEEAADNHRARRT